MSLASRMTVLLFVLMAFFSVTAQAYQLSTFNLRIEDPNTHLGRVLTDNVLLGLFNLNGDQNLAPGTITASDPVGGNSGPPDPVPESTPLILLGSTLLGIGALQRKLKI